MTEVVTKTVTLTNYGAQLLGEHALDLPPGHPVRAYVLLLLRRFMTAPRPTAKPLVGEPV